MPEKAIRQIELMLLLQQTRRGHSKEELAERFECAVRTLERDFEMFQRLGIKLLGTTNDQGQRYWRLDEEYLVKKPIDMDPTEVAGLVAAARMFKVLLAGSPFVEALDRLLERIRLAFPSPALRLYEEIADSQFIHIRSPMSNNYEPHEQAIRQIDRGIRESKALKIKYKGLKKKQHTTVYDPYTLVYYDHGGDLYLWCYSQPQKQRRTLRINRMIDVELTDISFDPPQDLDPVEEFKHSWGIYYDQGDVEAQEVQVRYTGLAAELVQEKTFHPSQSLEPDEQCEPDESIIATYHLSNFQEFKRWIRQFGPEAEILSPDWLREERRQLALAVAALHD